jgi:drug/metabolite transporter (DMT)-like permease
MLYAFLTALLWSASSIASARTAKHLGGPRANRARLALAVGLLALWLAATTGLHGWGPAAWWFVASGAIGLGLGDMALFSAYARLGARLPALFTHCLGAPLGAALEWAWLGTPLHWPEAACIAVILAGVALALTPDRKALFPGKGGDRSFLLGCSFGVLSACGLAISAVMSRKGFASAVGDGAPIAGLDAALLRNFGGLAVCLVWAPFTRKPDEPVAWRTVWPWLVFTALVGPTIGVVCYQMALSEVKAGVVQAVVALVPLLVIPLVWVVDGERPRHRAWIGGLLGVAGVAGMALLRHPG